MGWVCRTLPWHWKEEGVKGLFILGFPLTPRPPGSPWACRVSCRWGRGARFHGACWELCPLWRGREEQVSLLQLTQSHAQGQRVSWTSQATARFQLQQTPSTYMAAPSSPIPPATGLFSWREASGPHSYQHGGYPWSLGQLFPQVWSMSCWQWLGQFCLNCIRFTIELSCKNGLQTMRAQIMCILVHWVSMCVPAFFVYKHILRSLLLVQR